MAGLNRLTALKLSLLIAMSAVVCLAQFPPSDAGQYAAKAMTLTGQVSVLRDLQPWALSAGESVQVQQVIVTGFDGHAVFQVSDGSTFEVYPNSRVVFRKTPGDWRDLIDLLAGRVRVIIQHFGTTPNPNRILTPTAVISVRGTVFDVTVDNESESTLVEVEEGSVQVEHALLPNGRPTLVSPGQPLTVYRDQPLAQHFDKGNFFRATLRILYDAVAIVGRSTAPTHGGISLPGGGGGTVGDTAPKAPPPAAPPPLPPTSSLPPLK